jgi:hypothetical protein
VNPESPALAELRPLLDALCEETITPEQMRRLEELVLAHPEAEAHYVRYMSFYADLIRQFSGPPPGTAGAATVGGAAGVTVASPVAGMPAAPAVVAPVVPAADPGRPRGGRLRFLAWGTVAGLAAGLLLGLWLGVVPRRPAGHPAGGEATDDSVAVLLHTNRAEWEETGMPTRAGAPLPPGRLVLKSGSAQIEFYSGATVVLEGPTEFQLVSRTRAYCARGKLRARVPPHAQGFAVGSPAVNLIDRGTEFGLDVRGGKTEVHVFEGKVDLYDPGADPKAPPRTELTTGQGLSVDGAGGRPVTPDPAAFLTAGGLADRSAADTARRRAEWDAASRALRRDPALVVYYPFEVDASWDRRLRDEAGDRQLPRDGAIVGCAWGAGRWPGRQGLEFKRVGDRVRLHVPGEFRSLTLAAWVRPDALPNTNNALLMAEGWEEGEPHWQIGSDGTVILGIKGPPDYNPVPNVRGPQYRAVGVLTPEYLGRWVHLAVAYDADAGVVVHYLDGRPVARTPVELDLPIRIGDAELGNWTAAMFRTRNPVRNFSGGIDEFLLFSRPLAGAEVERLYAQGRPPP